MEVVVPNMAKIMSEKTRYELAEELGFAHKVKDGDWGNITTREAGSLVRAAIAKAEELMTQKNRGQ
ncbi:MAG: small, acid-soluble spore protein, alpha/beta type [Halanaerobiaceae bacterium]